MAVTNYYSIDGEILAERTSGSGRVDYLSDALGSTLATASQAAQVVNTYRYKPYGAQLSKSGASPDPAFRWVGSQGYRQTGTKWSEIYVVARHYGPSQGAWSTSDPLRTIRGVESPYTYVEANPTTLVDPSGLKPTKLKCFDDTYKHLHEDQNLCPKQACDLANKICKTNFTCGTCGSDPTPNPPGCFQFWNWLSYGWNIHNNCGGPGGPTRSPTAGKCAWPPPAPA